MGNVGWGEQKLLIKVGVSDFFQYELVRGGGCIGFIRNYVL